VLWACNVGRIPSLLYFDTETTGTDAGAEIISIAILDYNGNTWLNSLVRPLNMEAVNATTEVHGLTPAQLENAPTFVDLFPELERIMSDRLWCAYNADFDVQMIDQNCMMRHLPAIINRGVHDALTYYSQYAGLWLPESERWQKIKLAEAAQACGIVVEESHDALADTQTLFKLVEHMAESEEQSA
jgi:DNA polymerase III subunit epsilon